MLDGGFLNQATGQVYYPAESRYVEKGDDGHYEYRQANNLSPKAQEFVPTSVGHIPLQVRPFVLPSDGFSLEFGEKSPNTNTMKAVPKMLQKTENEPMCI